MNSKELEPLAEKALWMLREDAAKHGQDRANADHMDSWVKAEKARLKGLFVGVSNAQAEDEAQRHPSYLAALEAKKQADAIHYTNQYKREAAMAFVGAWQTVCANERKS